MRLSDLLDSRLIKVPLSARTKLDAITELVDLLHAAGRVRDRGRLLECVVARERQRTTAVGRSLAIPHAKCDACENLAAAVGLTAEPLDFEAIDGKPVRLVVLLAGPIQQAAQQIQVLARISRMVMNDGVLPRILSTDSAEQLLTVMREADAL